MREEREETELLNLKVTLLRAELDVSQRCGGSGDWAEVANFRTPLDEARHTLDRFAGQGAESRYKTRVVGDDLAPTWVRRDGSV